MNLYILFAGLDGDIPADRTNSPLAEISDIFQSTSDHHALVYVDSIKRDDFNSSLADNDWQELVLIDVPKFEATSVKRWENDEWLKRNTN